MSDESTRTSAVRRYVFPAAKIGVSLALLALLSSWVNMAELWASARKASLAWLAAAIGVHALNVLASTWRWHLLLGAQHVHETGRRLLDSMLVASFFNNFLPSNIGGDFIRIRDTARVARSKTLATTIVLVDRGLGLLALVLLSAVGATMASGLRGSGALPIWPSWLWTMFVVAAAITGPAMYSPSGVSRILQPLTVFHPEWVGDRIDTMTGAIGRFRERPAALAGCFAGALVVQGLVVLFYLAVVHALKIDIAVWDLAVIVPLSLVVQMLPVSVNGLGVREAAFSFYFVRLGLPIEGAVLLSLFGAILIMLFSLTGAVVYVSRRA